MEKKEQDSYQSQSHAATDQIGQNSVYENDPKMFQDPKDLSPIITDIGLDDEENSLTEAIELDNEASLILSVQSILSLSGMTFSVGAVRDLPDLVLSLIHI